MMMIDALQAVSRRDFLKASGALVVASAGTGAVLAAAPGAATAEGAAASPSAAAAPARPALVPGELDSWVAILPDGRVNAFFGKIDSGHTLDVAIAQIVAEELDVAVAKVDVLCGDSGTSCNQGGASGSFGINLGSRPLRKAAAEARRVLVEEAAQSLKVA